MVYLKEHETNGVKSADVKGNPSPNLEDYYRNSMPMSDLLGDVDAFGMAHLVGPQILSTALRYYYLSESGGPPLFPHYRWRNFAAANNLTYTEAGRTINWTTAARQNVMRQITDFANLFAGRTHPLKAMTIGVRPQPWPRAGAFADRFLRDIKKGLESELARLPSRPTRGT